ncbi:hypothetical protein V7182_14565 [Neobacillus drentensis]|uniref:hypothetical protein n=1 Tax=Neobacillus drentensis TaxID=220684 RepID=UPI003000398A
MPNYIVYLVLLLISTILFVLSWRKAANKKLIILYLCMAGSIYYFEFVILVILKSYEYVPGIFKDPYFDNVFGANVSDGFIVPLATVFIAVFDLSIGWIVFIVLCFIGIEELFLELNVYKQFWWKTIYTALSLPIQFALGKWVWYLIRFHSNRFIVRLGTLYFANITIQASFLYYFSAVFGVIYYRVNWFDEPTRGHIAFAAMFAFVASIFFALLVVSKASHLWKMVLIVCGAALNVMLYKWDILYVSGYWVLVILTLAQTSYLFILIYFQKVLEEA